METAAAEAEAKPAAAVGAARKRARSAQNERKKRIARRHLAAQRKCHLPSHLSSCLQLSPLGLGVITYPVFIRLRFAFHG